MDYPEYLEIFSNCGDYEVKVKFKDKSLRIAKQFMAIEELSRLIDPASKNLYDHLYFDSHLFLIKKYAINPLGRILTIETD